MTRPTRRLNPADLPRDIYPVLRVSGEYYLRGFDLLSDLQDDVLQGMIFMTLICDQMTGSARPSISIRELARKLGVPYETVRRHAVELVRNGQCIENDGGIAVPAAMRRRRRITMFLRAIYINATRLLIDLTRIGVARYGMKSPQMPRSGRLGREQLVIARAGTSALLAGLKAVRTYWKGDVMKGLVYTAIWTANVKHVTNTKTAGTQDVLRDEHRLPVRVMAISNSLRLPYETVRRHAQVLMEEGLCARVGDRGLIVPATTHRRLVGGALSAHRLTVDFLADLRQAGVKV